MDRSPRRAKPLALGALHTRLLALWLLWRHPQTPRVIKTLAIGLLAHALSPIDLIRTSSQCSASSTI